MICPVCKRDLAPSLSICFACGAMMNDTVREELQTKISSVSGDLTPLQRIESPANVEPAVPVVRHSEEVAALPAPALKHPKTFELPRKQTSPTLVEFQRKNAALPDWRLQLQNSIQKRRAFSPRAETTSEPAQSAGVSGQRTKGANALELETENSPTAESLNPRLANALRRIEESRRAFLSHNGATASAGGAAAKPATRNYPFNVVSRSGNVPPSTPAAAVSSPKPRLVSSLRIEKKALDTNKLPPLPEPAKLSSSLDEDETADKPLLRETPAIERVKLPLIDDLAADADPAFAEETDTDEIDDLAPFTMRFGSGLFDLIIGGFATLIILSPFIASGGSWFSVSGVALIVATLSIFQFMYLTACIAVWGKTFGMRIFSLELIDIEQNHYPSVHQAAVNSAVYLLSMALGGIGFLTLLYNEEKRAVHDIISGTLLVRNI
jgi:uncharacterized RDD family membrane protein YckC